jgi:hypothetical protein
MKKIIVTLLTVSYIFCAKAQITPFEKNSNTTATYQECIAYYKQLKKLYKGIDVREVGTTDAGLPLHLILINSENNFNTSSWQKQNKCVLLINNGIHPGEPDGIDASMMFCREVLEKIKAKTFSKDLCIAIIPVYNIGGALNRSEYFRIDQNGPVEFGSRGNSQNLDLNRDFIKCDSKEAQTFSQIFQMVQPHIFLDNHVSDGADYPYVMTLATTQKDKLGGVLSNYLTTQLEPALFEAMQKKNYPMIPYVNAWGRDAKQGWPQFFDSPRYSSGYATLWNTLAFVPETHMLKPYKDRVASTKALMECFVDFSALHAKEIVALKKTAISNMMEKSLFPIAWQNLKDSSTQIQFNGYEYESLSQQPWTAPIPHYNRAKPYTATIPFYNYFKETENALAPKFYIIPQGWHKVINLLKNNSVEMIAMQKDTMMKIEYYKIVSYKSSDKSYEGHHANSNIVVNQQSKTMAFRKGDIMIPVQQKAKRFLIETLEPNAMDSYFSWNFFDAILVQKEGFTDYAFQENAQKILQSDPALKNKLITKQQTDSAFAKDADAQMEFVFKNSPYYEPQHNVYPVYKVTDYSNLRSEKVETEIKNKKDE